MLLSCALDNLTELKQLLALLSIQQMLLAKCPSFFPIIKDFNKFLVVLELRVNNFNVLIVFPY